MRSYSMRTQKPGSSAICGIVEQKYLDPANGLYYPKTPLNTCHYGWDHVNLQLDHDLGVISGRTVPWQGFGSALKTTQAASKMARWMGHTLRAMIP